MKINQLPNEILWMIANRTVDRLDESAPNPFKIAKPKFKKMIKDHNRKLEKKAQKRLVKALFK